MKKLFIMFLLIGFVCTLYSDMVTVRAIIKSMDVISPDGEISNYTNPIDVPKIPYSSKIIANGMLILNYHSVGIVLKNKQGLFVSKCPINNILVFSKVENTRPGAIVVTFDAKTIAQMDPDTTFSLEYNETDNSVIMGIIDGHALMKIENEEIELTAKETFKYILKGEINYAI